MEQSIRIYLEGGTQMYIRDLCTSDINTYVYTGSVLYAADERFVSRRGFCKYDIRNIGGEQSTRISLD